jgi:hypothetical protein
MVKDAIAHRRDMITQFFVGLVEHSETQHRRDMITQFFVAICWVSYLNPTYELSAKPNLQEMRKVLVNKHNFFPKPTLK